MPSSILNSDDGVVSGTSGIKTTGGDDGVLKIQNNGVDAVTVASDGDVTLAADLSVTGNSSVTGNLLFNSGYGSVATAYGCRAWVNFNGTGTPAIRASGNVSSITDNGTGDYTVNFTTAMPDANYQTSVTPQAVSTTAGCGSLFGTSPQTTSSVRIRTWDEMKNANGHFDPVTVGVAVFR
jgi:hypothetical protein